MLHYIFGGVGFIGGVVATSYHVWTAVLGGRRMLLMQIVQMQSVIMRVRRFMFGR